LIGLKSLPAAIALLFVSCFVSAQEARPPVCVPAHFASVPGGFRYGLPPSVEKKGLTFAEKRIPIHRKDVRDRIVDQINYLLMDRRSRIQLWLSRADEFKGVIVPILRKHHVPTEFLFLAAIESSYDSRALSSAGAFGYWQFIKATALKGPSNNADYDWKMQITKWKDERGDLMISTASAAKYLAYMNRAMKVRLNGKGEKEGFHDWSLAAAAYNAGPARVIERLNSFGTDDYWDVPLPDETEKYVPRLIATWLISNHRDFYGIRGLSHGTKSFDTVTKVTLKKDLTFAAAAKMLDTTPRTFWELNTQVCSDKGVFPATSGGKAVSHTIHVPKGSAKKFYAQLKAHGYTTK